MGGTKWLKVPLFLLCFECKADFVVAPRYYILIAIVVALLLPWVFQWLAVKSLEKRKKSSKTFILKNLRYIVYVCGQVRSGKTTFMSGYVNLRSEELIEKAKRKIEFTCLAFPDVPFWMADEEIKAAFKRGCINPEDVVNALTKKGAPFYDYLKLSYNNMISFTSTPFREMLYDYVDACFSLLRANPVYYYARAFYIWCVDKFAMDYDPKMMNIKDCMANEVGHSDKHPTDSANDYHLLTYSIIAEDEKQLSGKDNTTFMSYQKADGGASDCLRLIGQLGQETIYYVTTNQVWGQDVNRERNLATDVVSMEKSTAVNPRFMTMWVLRLIEKPFQWHLKRLRKKRSYLITPLLDITHTRYVLSWIMFKKKKVASKGVVQFRGIIYHDPSDVGKKTVDTLKKADRLNAVIDIKYCFGSVNTFMFHSVQQTLISKSRWTLKDEPKEVKDSDLAHRVLQKRDGGGEKGDTKRKKE